MSEPIKELYKICQEERTKLAALLAETSLERNTLKADNEALRANCAAMGRALEGCIEELVCFHPKMNAEEPCATYGTWLRAKESLEDNPGQALRKYVKALERVLRNLVNKLHEVEPHITAAFTLQYIHGARYEGPNYAAELEAAEKVLAACRGLDRGTVPGNEPKAGP